MQSIFANLVFDGVAGKQEWGLAKQNPKADKAGDRRGPYVFRQNSNLSTTEIMAIRYPYFGAEDFIDLGGKLRFWQPDGSLGSSPPPALFPACNTGEIVNSESKKCDTCKLGEAFKVIGGEAMCQPCEPGRFSGRTKGHGNMLKIPFK